jgi:uncharacterized alkaline shock family protein YloU
MSDKNDTIVTENESGSINYSNEVLAKIAALATDEVEGVVGTSGGSLSDMLGVKNRGIRVELEEESVTVDLNIVIEYGKKLHVVSKAVQDSVKKGIENMTALKVAAVNVNVHSLHMEKPPEEPKEDEKKEK